MVSPMSAPANLNPAKNKTPSPSISATQPLFGMAAAEWAAQLQAQIAAASALAKKTQVQTPVQTPVRTAPPAPAPTSTAVTPQPSTLIAPPPSGLSATQIAGMSLSQIKALTPSQLASLTPAVLAALSAADIAALSPTQIASFSPDQVAYLSSQQVGALTALQLAAVTKAQLGNLSAAQLGAISVSALSGFSTTQIGILTAKQVMGFTAAQFSALSGAQLGAFSIVDIQAFSAVQLKSLSGAQIAGFSAAQINAFNSTQLGALNINYNSMLSLLQTDAVGGMTAAKFGALQALAAKLNAPGGIVVSPYVQQITDDVILGNAANATWTGGAMHATVLGNLSANSTQGQVNELIGKWFLGTDLPSSAVNLTGEQPFSVNYSAVNTPLFGAAGPLITDVNQGALGDCFVLAPLAEMASQDPSAIRSMITSNGNDSFSVRFMVNGAADYITVNNDLADGGKIFNSGPASWAGLIEQAYTELQGGGAVTGNTFSGNSFASIGNGGWVEATLEEFTGATLVDDFNAAASGWTSDVINGASLSVPGKPSSATLQSSQAGLSGKAVLSTLIADLLAGEELVLSSFTNAVDSNGRFTLVADHAMAVTGYDARTQMLEVYNPWGTSAGQSWDTTFEVSLNTLLSDGDTISIAANAPLTGGSQGLPLVPVSTAGLMASATSPFTAGSSGLGLAAAG